MTGNAVQTPRDVAIVGDIVRIPSGPAHDLGRPHVNIVIGINTKAILLVSLCSVRKSPSLTGTAAKHDLIFEPRHIPDAQLLHASYVNFKKPLVIMHASFADYEYLGETPPFPLSNILHKSRTLLPHFFMSTFYRVPPPKGLAGLRGGPPGRGAPRAGRILEKAVVGVKMPEPPR